MNHDAATDFLRKFRNGLIDLKVDLAHAYGTKHPTTYQASRALFQVDKLRAELDEVVPGYMTPERVPLYKGTSKK